MTHTGAMTSTKAVTPAPTPAHTLGDTLASQAMNDSGKKTLKVVHVFYVVRQNAMHHVVTT
jgi:hypothetical protein